MYCLCRRSGNCLLAYEDKCAMCGKYAIANEDHETKNENRHRLEDNLNSDIIVEQINGTCYIFDTSNCAVMFKKFVDMYGSSFADQ
jgi:hypothetical protein